MTLWLADLSYGPGDEEEGLPSGSLLSVGPGTSSLGLLHKKGRGGGCEECEEQLPPWMLGMSLGKEMSHPVSQPNALLSFLVLFHLTAPLCLSPFPPELHVRP